MSLFVIGDTHLSLSTDKPMDIFGGWKNYMQRPEENWRSVVQPQDTVIIPGDVSWGMSLEQAKEDFLFLHRLPGKNPDEGQPRLLVDHPRKDGELFEGNGLDSLSILHNNAVSVEGLSLCGSRGWMFEQGQEHDKRLSTARRAGSGHPFRMHSGSASRRRCCFCTIRLFLCRTASRNFLK